MAWRKRWWVHVWSGGLGIGSMADDRESVRQVHVDTVVALHDLITEVRADPTVRRWAYGPFDELDTAGAPTHCACGRELKGLRGYAAEYRWRLCIDCPGHDQYRCRLAAVRSRCGQRTLPNCRKPAQSKPAGAVVSAGAGGPSVVCLTEPTVLACTSASSSSMAPWAASRSASGG